MMPNSNEEKALEASYYFEAVVQNDVEGGNYSYNNLVLATENATEAGNGITLYDSNLTEPSKHDLNKGDKVKVTLASGSQNSLSDAETYLSGDEDI